MKGRCPHTFGQIAWVAENWGKFSSNATFLILWQVCCSFFMTSFPTNLKLQVDVDRFSFPKLHLSDYTLGCFFLSVYSKLILLRQSWWNHGRFLFIFFLPFLPFKNLRGRFSAPFNLSAYPIFRQVIRMMDALKCHDQMEKPNTTLNRVMTHSSATLEDLLFHEPGFGGDFGVWDVLSSQEPGGVGCLWVWVLLNGIVW